MIWAETEWMISWEISCLGFLGDFDFLGDFLGLFEADFRVGDFEVDFRAGDFEVDFRTGDFEADFLVADFDRVGDFEVDFDVDFRPGDFDVDFLVGDFEVDFLVGDFEIDFLTGDFDLDFLTGDFETDFLLTGLLLAVLLGLISFFPDFFFFLPLPFEGEFSLFGLAVAFKFSGNLQSSEFKIQNSSLILSLFGLARGLVIALPLVGSSTCTS